MVMFGGNYKIDNPSSILVDRLYEDIEKRLMNEKDTTKQKIINLLLHYPQLTGEDLQKITVPILVMAGEKDLIKEEHTREMQQNLPNSKLFIAKGASHYIPWEDHATFNNVVLEYLLDDKPVRTVSGRVIDREDRALEYVNIGIPKKGFGTMSLRNGLFELGIPYRYRNDTLTFSMVGFETVKMAITNLNNDEKIVLFTETYSLSEIVITAAHPKRQTIGINRHSPYVGATAKHNEWAVSMKPRKLPAKVEKLNIHMNWIDESADSSYFRINFYAVTDSMPSNNLSNQDIVIKCLIKKGWNEFDLRPFNIVMSEDFFASIQWLTDLDQRPERRQFHYGAVLISSKKLFERNTSFEDWHKIPGVTISMNLEILY
jgi:hypothetical protein